METQSARDFFGKALAELGHGNKNIVVLSGDLEDSTRAEYFKKEFPERFFNLGISEQDILGTACGMASNGLIPFVCSFAVFLTNRAYDFIRISCCYNNMNVKIVCTHAGITVGPDGATAQCLEDLAIMRVLPNMRVICPADAIETQKATRAMAEAQGPFYMRLPRPAFPAVTTQKDEFVIGKANILKEGKDITIIACGIMVYESLKAAELLEKEGISAGVINMHTIKPIDKDVVISQAKITGAIVTAEEHQINCGLGSAVCEVLSLNYPVPVEMVAVKDTFGESGESEELMKKYELKDTDIAEKARRVIKRKIK